MKLIKPKLISGEIMTLIEEADEKLIIISPYYNISKWDKLLNTFTSLKKKKLTVEFYVRANEPDSFNEIKRIGFIPFEIPNLHTKLYLNESYGIVASMNLNVSSDTNSLDIAYKTEGQEEYDDLYKYYKRYIKSHNKDSIKEAITNEATSVIVNSENLQPFSAFQIKSENIDWSNWKEIVTNSIREKFSYKYTDYYIKNGSVYFKNGTVTFSCYFHTSSKVTSFITKLSCAHNFYIEFISEETKLTNEMGAKINIPLQNNDGMDIFISLGNPIASKDINYVANDDIPVMIKTLSCSLYVLAFYNLLLKNKMEENARKGIRF